MKKPIISVNQMMSCYFRTSVQSPYRKALVQITEWCNLHCSHCFVSAGQYGDTMSLESVRDILVPRLKECRVLNVTLTGGEPFAHPNVIEIVSLCKDAGMKVGICTNATCISEDQMKALAALGAHCNVSLDGFSPESHGRFRGDKASFATTISTIEMVARYGLLQGFLVTPNNLAEVEEYAKICEFATVNGATYVLMNPLSSMGRGVKTAGKLGVSNEVMRQIANVTSQFADKVEIVPIRFPNEKKLPLTGCEAGNIIYVFTLGELTVCPYLVFSARTPQSQHKAEEFIVGNIFRDANIAVRLDEYKLLERYRLGGNPTCGGCRLNAECGKGCPAAIISSGKRIEEMDAEVCPVFIR
ncbi:MAG: radical SAM protein [Candidatus Pacebacteria bacterium]|nr:radical SAM protein [Candidatus Paceibacterota bacterium]